MAKTKKYSLNNSYFKIASYSYGNPELPKEPIDIINFRKERWELPYSAEPTGERIYEMICEYQKRNTSYKYLDQFFTPPKVADQFQRICNMYWNRSNVLEIGCGSWMLTKRVKVHGKFDIVELDQKMIEICKLQDIQGDFINENFKNFNQTYYDVVFWNPPYEPLQEVLEKTLERLNPWWYAFFILPTGYIQKERPKRIQEIMSNFYIIYTEKSCDEFLRTKANTEIVVLQKK